MPQTPQPAPPTNARPTRREQPIDPTPWQDAEEMRWAARHWAARISVRTPIIQIRPMTTKWASISTGRRMTLNTELLSLPRALGEFAIVHELVHIQAPNHGKIFKSFMFAYMPDWQTRERQLQAHSNESNSARTIRIKRTQRAIE